MSVSNDREKTNISMEDLVLESWKRLQYVEQADGKFKQERVVDERRGWWQTHHIGSPAVASFAKYRELLGNLFKNAGYHMTAHRAAPFQKMGMEYCQALDYMIDAKSSESIRDNNNAQLTLLAMISKSHTEKTFSVKGELQKSVWDGITGRQADKQASS